MLARLHAEPCPPLVGYGVGHCPGHFGELLQGAFRSATGQVVRGLVTLPMRTIGTTCRAIVSVGTGSVVAPPGKTKAARAIGRLLRDHDPEQRFDVAATFDSNIPAGIGMGSSTADIVAALRAVESALGRSSGPERLSALAVATEIASDATAFDRCILFAQREGYVLEDFARPVPHLLVVGFVLDAGTTFDTVATAPARYDGEEIALFDRLRSTLGAAIEADDADLVALVATESARVNQRHFPKPGFDDLLDLAGRAAALGVCVAHSGTIGGLLLPLTEASRAAVPDLATAGAQRGLDYLDCFCI